MAKKGAEVEASWVYGWYFESARAGRNARWRLSPASAAQAGADAIATGVGDSTAAAAETARQVAETVVRYSAPTVQATVSAVSREKLGKSAVLALDSVSVLAEAGSALNVDAAVVVGCAVGFGVLGGPGGCGAGATAFGMAAYADTSGLRAIAFGSSSLSTLVASLIDKEHAEPGADQLFQSVAVPVAVEEPNTQTINYGTQFWDDVCWATGGC